jgi:hypothetical protein
MLHNKAVFLQLSCKLNKVLNSKTPYYYPNKLFFIVLGKGSRRRNWKK